MLTTTIRDFQPADLTSMRQLIHRTIETCYAGVYPPRVIQFFLAYHSEERIRERQGMGDILVVESEGTLVATGSLVGNEILGVFVAPEHQGHGYGSAVMHALESKAKEKGCTEVILSISLPSKGFYDNLGYEVTETCHVDIGDGIYLDYWQARKALVLR